MEARRGRRRRQGLRLRSSDPRIAHLAAVAEHEGALYLLRVDEAKVSAGLPRLMRPGLPPLTRHRNFLQADRKLIRTRHVFGENYPFTSAPED